MASQRKALIFSNGEMVIREVLKYWITGTFVTLSILVGMNQAIAFQTSLPDTDVPIQMDSVFKATKTGINSNAFPGIKVRGNRIAWKKSVLTGKIEGETVYRFQTKYGIHNESKQDTADQDRYKKSRAEYNLNDTFLWEGDSVTYKYSFYVPKEIKLPGNRVHITGQWKNVKAGTIYMAIQTAPARNAVHNYSKWFKKSEYADMELQPQDLIFKYRGILGNDSKNYKSHAIPLARKDAWQGKWNTVEITTHHADNGSFKLVFNGKTIIDCTGCDAMPNPKHKQFYEDEDAFKKHKKDQLTFHFGIYQFAWDPDRIDPTQNVNSVVYKKDIMVRKINSASKIFNQKSSGN